MSGMTGCAKEKHKLVFDSFGLASERMEYAVGEKVKVTYDFIATDTDYYFHIDDDVKMTREYDGLHGYIFTFEMPDHDVTITVESHNTMTAFPDPTRVTDPVSPDGTGSMPLNIKEGFDPHRIHKNRSIGLFHARGRGMYKPFGSKRKCSGTFSLLCISEKHARSQSDLRLPILSHIMLRCL